MYSNGGTEVASEPRFKPDVGPESTVVRPIRGGAARFTGVSHVSDNATGDRRAWSLRVLGASFTPGAGSSAGRATDF
jgi:hypothetical protein